MHDKAVSIADWVFTNLSCYVVKKLKGQTGIKELSIAAKMTSGNISGYNSDELDSHKPHLSMIMLLYI